MKLITKITINHFIITSIVLLMGGIASYFFIREEVDEKMDWKLLAEKRQILEHACTIADISNQSMNISSYLEIIPLTSYSNIIEGIKDTLVYNHFRHRLEPFRQLTFAYVFDGQTYQIVLRKNMIESRDLREGITDSMQIVFIVLLLILLFSNYIMSKKLWYSFYQTIHKINRYDLTKNDVLALPPSKIQELNELNQAINKMAEKIQVDYLNVKEFSENASHEIQTPLSIIKSKTELLIQNEGMSEEQLLQIQEIDQAATRLSRLNQSLLLLTRIENRQFEYDEEINFSALIEIQLNELDEFIKLQRIIIHTQIENARPIRMNPVLADVLLRNLLTNALRYCSKPGEIQLSLTQTQFCIANTGVPLKINEKQIFERFKKDKQSSDSLGLGLSIVKKICDLYHFNIHYTYQNNYHTFKIN